MTVDAGSAFEGFAGKIRQNVEGGARHDPRASRPFWDRSGDGGPMEASVQRERNMTPRPHGGGQQRRIVGNAERELKKLVEAHPDWTEEELATELVEKHGVSASSVTVGRAVRRLGYSVKKRPSSLQSATEQTCSDEEKSTSAPYPARPLHVWFLWTKPARTSR